MLEHFSFNFFKNALSNMYLISRSYVILSLPDSNRYYNLYIQIPKMGTIKKVFTFPRFRKLIQNSGCEHKWEIGKKGYPLKNILNSINKAGFRIEKTYRPFEIPYHRFFILKKI